jgi:hypothetical protein
MLACPRCHGEARGSTSDLTHTEQACALSARSPFGTALGQPVLIDDEDSLVATSLDAEETHRRRASVSRQSRVRRLVRTITSPTTTVAVAHAAQVHGLLGSLA